jgi:hypothetical protein
MYIVELIYPGTWLNLDNEDKAWEISGLIMSMETQIINMALALTFFDEEMTKAVNDITSQKIEKLRKQNRDLHIEIENRYKEELGEEEFYKNYPNIIMKIDMEIKRKKWQEGDLPDSYKHQLPFIHAHSFLYALDTFGKFLDVIADEDGLPEAVRIIRDEFEKALPSLRKIRNSALHIEDRSRGFGTIEQARNKERMKLQPINNRMISAPGGALVLSNLNGNKLGYTIDDGSFQEIEISQSTLNLASGSLQNIINSFAWNGPPRITPY